MKLDPKYFNLFIIICAAFTVFAIFYGTLAYHQGQEKTFRENVEELDFSDLYFKYVGTADSVSLTSLRGEPVVIDFWATWSGKSHLMQEQLHEHKMNDPELTILAAAVRDDMGEVRNYIDEKEYDFIFVEGTEFYHKLQVPGVPSQILIDRTGAYFDIQIGEDGEALSKKIERLIAHE